MLKTLSQPASLLAWMECLSDPTRLRLLRVLEGRELGVVDLCDVLQLPQSTVSRHLKVLTDQGWVRPRRQATTHLYTMVLDELDASARRLWLLSREQTENWVTWRQDQARLERRLAQRQSKAEAFFAGAAGEWDKLRTELYGQGFTLSAMLSLLPRQMVVADLGCGTGSVVAALAPHVKRVIGVDSSAPMLKAAEKRTSGLENVELKQGDLGSLPMEDQEVDAALMLLALTYVPEPQSALRQMHRVLRPGGRAVIVDLLPHDREDFRRRMGQHHLGFSPQRLALMLPACGLTNADIRPLAPEANVKGPALFLVVAERAR